eukprot:1150197-Pelagomonas_calceolata.AAC.1
MEFGSQYRGPFLDSLGTLDCPNWGLFVCWLHIVPATPSRAVCDMTQLLRCLPLDFVSVSSSWSPQYAVSLTFWWWDPGRPGYPSRSVHQAGAYANGLLPATLLISCSLEILERKRNGTMVPVETALSKETTTISYD